MKTTRIQVWRAYLDGECKQIHQTQQELWHAVETNNAWYKPRQRSRWTTECVEEDVPIVEGEAHDWNAEGGCGGVHVHWICPVCGTLHICDQYEERSPALWFCQDARHEAVVLVSWRRIERAQRRSAPNGG
jgi:hypothetical protein